MSAMRAMSDFRRTPLIAFQISTHEPNLARRHENVPTSASGHALAVPVTEQTYAWTDALNASPGNAQARSPDGVTASRDEGWPKREAVNSKRLHKTKARLNICV